MSLLKITVVLFFSYFVMITASFADNGQAYSKLENTPYLMSELEWQLLQVKIEMAGDGVEIKFDEKRRIIMADAWVLTYTIDTNDIKMIRALFSSLANKLSAKLGRVLPEFKLRGEKDLIISFLLGREGADQIAVYENGTLEFTNSFYSYLRESGRR